MSNSYIKSMPATDEYRDGWDRIFGRREPPAAELRCKCRGIPKFRCSPEGNPYCQVCGTKCVSWRELRDRRVRGLPSWPKK